MSLETDILLLRREKALLLAQEQLRKDNQISFYSPHEKQRNFHSAASFHYRYARTGNRFGKSHMGAAEDIAFALGFRPWIAEGDPLRTLGIPNHPTKGVILTADWDKSTEVFTEQTGANLGKLFAYIPKSCLGQPTRNHSGAIDRIPVKHISGGWSVIHLDTVKSYKQNPLGFESSAWDWVHIDEPIPEGMWKAVARGLVDRGGKAWFTCTPLTEPWIDKEFVPDLQDQSRDIASTISDSISSRWMMTGSMDDNPHNSPEDIARYMSWLTEDERECRRTGIPTAYAGLVYKEFRWDTHVSSNPPVGWATWSNPPADHSIRFAIDYHPRKPHHVLFIATSQYESQFVFAEIFRSCLMSELVAEIRSVLGNRESTVPGLIDPLADTPNRVTDITPLEEVLRLGLPVLPATKDPHNGILRVKELLASRDRSGQPTILINPRCQRFMFEIARGYIWDGELNKPLKENDDAMENFYRLALQGLNYIEPSSDSDYVPLAPVDLPSNVLDIRDWEDEEEREEQKRARRSKRYPSSHPSHSTSLSYEEKRSFGIL